MSVPDLVQAAARLAASAPAPRHPDAVAMAELVRTGAASAAELVDAAIGRLEAANPALNLVSHTSRDFARARAEAGPAGPLAGVPTLVKELQPQAGMPFTQGSRAWATRVASEDSPYVTAMLAAGLVPIGRSTSPEFGLTATGEALVNGPTRNPWNTDYSAGGSSSGAAAAVAAGVVPVAHATDGGGSIRIPASANGLVGLKPSRDRMPGQLGEGVVALSVNGCESRTVRDTALWFAATERADSPHGVVGLVAGPGEAALRIGTHVETGAGGLPSDDVQRVFADAEALLRGLGHTVAPVELAFDGAQTGVDFMVLWRANALQHADDVAAALGRAPTADDLEPLTLVMADWARHAGRAPLDAAIGRLRGVAAAYAGQFDSIDVYMTPVLSRPPVRIGELAPGVDLAAQVALLNGYAAYTGVENVAGAPSISLPVGISGDGLPIGIQFATRPGGERLLLELAYALERELRWHDRTPPLWVGG